VVADKNESARRMTHASALAIDLGDACEQLLARAARLSRGEIARLDDVDRARSHLLPAIWDLLRDQLDGAGFRSARFAARRASWSAVNRSLVAVGLERVVDDGYWRVTRQPGAGAARAARYAACALVYPAAVDADVVLALLDPWRVSVGDLDRLSGARSAGPEHAERDDSRG
jgi:hypothetical protein